MSADLSLLNPGEIMRRPMRLSELLGILASGVFENDMCTISGSIAHDSELR